jgi:serine/threonine protein kinase
MADTFDRKGEPAVGYFMRQELLQNDATTRYEAITHPTLASRDGSVDVNAGRALQLANDEGIQTDPLSKYSFLATICRSPYAKVFLAESKATHCLYAIKTMKKDFLVENNEIQSIRYGQQVSLLAMKKHHPFLVYLHSLFQSETRVYFVMEHIAGGDLLFHMQYTSFSPKQTLFLSLYCVGWSRFYAAEILLAVRFLHENKIVHRTLSLENVLLTSDGHVKLTGYRFSKEGIGGGSTTTTFCGIPHFMAPEVFPLKALTDRRFYWSNDTDWR